MNALKIAAGACAPLLLAACAAGPAVGHHGEPAGQGTAQSAPPPGQLGTVTGVFHRVGGPLGLGGQQPKVVPLTGRMRFTRPGHPAVIVPVGRSGRFTVQLPPGTYRVTGITPDIVTVLNNGRQLDGRCDLPKDLRVRTGRTGHITVVCAVP
ncbi:MAG TPA: hypothetical protein VID31_10890 [Streptosporangiaceae bacterium]|jgi:hypothetical protein